MQTVPIRIEDTNRRDKGLQLVAIELDGDGALLCAEYEGRSYSFRRTGVNLKTGKPMTELGAEEGALRLWIADDLSFACED